MKSRLQPAVTRRRFLSSSGAGALAALGAGLLSCSPAGARPLNALLIVCDDLNDSVAGMGGHPQAKTPQYQPPHGPGRPVQQRALERPHLRAGAGLLRTG